MPRINKSIDTHVYYSILKSDKKIFADERDKWKFLDTLLQLNNKNSFSVYAFSVLDDNVHILWRTGEAQQKEIMSSLIGEYTAYYEKLYRIQKDAATVEVNFSEITDLSQIPTVCCEIHYLPVRCGYAEKMMDYWWSSFQTYRRAYRWPVLDEAPVLHYFSEDLEEGSRCFMRFHRRLLPDKKTKQN